MYVFYVCMIYTCLSTSPFRVVQHTVCSLTWLPFVFLFLGLRYDIVREQCTVQYCAPNHVLYLF